MISQYNLPADQQFPLRGLMQFVSKRILLQGFIVGDKNMGPKYYAEHQEKVGKWIADGTIKPKTDVVDGIDKAADALVGLFKGENFGKLVLKVGELQKVSPLSFSPRGGVVGAGMLTPAVKGWTPLEDVKVHQSESVDEVAMTNVGVNLQVKSAEGAGSQSYKYDGRWEVKTKRGALTVNLRYVVGARRMRFLARYLNWMNGKAMMEGSKAHADLWHSSTNISTLSAIELVMILSIDGKS